MAKKRTIPTGRLKDKKPCHLQRINKRLRRTKAAKKQEASDRRTGKK